MIDEINQEIARLHDAVRWLIETDQRVTIDLRQYREFYDSVQRFVGKYGLGQTNEWRKLDQNLIRTSKEYLSLKEARAIQRALEALRDKAVENEKENHGAFPEYWTYVHPEIQRVSEKAMTFGMYAEAVEAAFKEVNVHVKRKTGSEKDGVKLMQWAFSPDSPVLRVEEGVKTQSGKDTQTGYMYMFSGAISAIRNPKAHENMFISREDALRKLYFASMLMFKLDASDLVVRPGTSIPKMERRS